MSWTEERVEILTKMWTEGNSAAEIAKALGGITRNAVIGKAHRLGLSGRASPIKKKKTATTVTKKTAKKTKKNIKKSSPKATKTSDKKEKTAKKVYKKETTLDSNQQQKIIKNAIREATEEASNNGKNGKISFMELSEKVCKWPIGDPQSPDFYFCGKPSPQGIPYCQEHIEMAYQMPKKTSDKRKSAMKVVADIKDKASTEAEDEIDVDIDIEDVDIEPVIDDADDDIISTEITETAKAK